AVVQAGERLTLVPGVRVDYFSDIQQGSVNPRLTARFKLAPETTLKGSVSLEGFYKRLSDLEVNGVGPDGNPLLVNGGKGRIYGLELLAKLNPTGKAFGFVAYTLSRSERND